MALSPVISRCTWPRYSIYAGGYPGKAVVPAPVARGKPAVIEAARRDDFVQQGPRAGRQLRAGAHG